MDAAWLGTAQPINVPKVATQKCIENGGHEKRRRIAREMQPEIGEQQKELEHGFDESDDHERENLAQQELMRRNVRHVNLKNGFQFAFFGRRESSQQRREHGNPQDEDARSVELLRIAAGVEPEADIGRYGDRMSEAPLRAFQAATISPEYPWTSLAVFASVASTSI
jgi:hypothetical protein